MDKRRFQNEVQRIISQYADPKLSELFRQIAESIQIHIDAGLSASEAINAALGLVAPEIGEEVGKIARQCMFQAACAGYGILPSVVANAKAIEHNLSQSWTADKMKLSSRLHGTGQDMRQAITFELKLAMDANAGWRQAARYLYDGYGAKTVLNTTELPAYLDRLAQAAKKAVASGHLDKAAVAEYERELRKARRLLKKMDAGGTTGALKAGYKKLMMDTNKLTEKRLQNAIRMACEERARYYAERIVRTESARAWFDGFVAKNGEDPDVVGYRWTLSSRHPKADVCDMHAHVDFYGMGPGVYPKNSVPPLPAHPHCLCSLLPVYVGEVQQVGNFNAQAGDDYLENASLHSRQELLGVKGEEAWKRGRSNWTELAGKRGWQEHLDPLARLSDDDFTA
jgi:hypothetical protein